MPFSHLNQVRREAVALLEQAIRADYHRQPRKMKGMVVDGVPGPRGRCRSGPSF